jgi:Cof subfamily protein (haloacid dehalogenase superfamily)
VVCNDIFLVVTDVDGTLIKESSPINSVVIPQLNLDAAKEIVARNLLTIATGRSCITSRAICEKLPTNLPAILYNGSCIYDYKEERLLFSVCQPQSAIDVLRQVMEKYDDCGVLMANLKGEFVVRNDRFLSAYSRNLGVTIEPTVLADCSGMLKALVSCDMAKQDEVYEFMCGVMDNELSLTRSEKCFIEILPSAVSKGAALVKLLELIDLPLANVFAIGDYYNDVSMLELVGCPIAVASAPECVKSICKHVVSNAEDGSLMDVWEILKNSKRS